MPQPGRPHGEGEGLSVGGGREKHGGQQPFLWFSQEEQASQGPQA